MGNLIYLVKIGIVTAVLIMAMQIKIGNYTLETHAETFIRTSSITSIVRDVADGGFIFAKSIYRTTSKTIDSFFTRNFKSENSPGRRKLVEVRRSLGFQTEKEKRLEKAQLEKEEMENAQEQIQEDIY